MAFKRALVEKLFNLSKITNPALTRCRISSSSSAVKSTAIRPDLSKVDPDPGDDGIFRRFLHRRPAFQSPASFPELRSLETGEKLVEKLRAMDIARNRIRFDGLVPPPPSSDENKEVDLTVDDARKILKLWQLEKVKSKLRKIVESCISYGEFVQICVDECGCKNQGIEFAKLLDQSGNVIVLGNVVFLRPGQVVNAVQSLLCVPVPRSNDWILKELEAMENQKAVIDKKAESLVRHELWCGLGYLVVQTAAFMRLTFWELSWDVMEPICFYVTSVYFMAGYAFFLRTSKEPSFEGYFQSRFNAKQRKLMKARKFDFEKYNELRKACYPDSQPQEKLFSFKSSAGNRERAEDALQEQI